MANANIRAAARPRGCPTPGSRATRPRCRCGLANLSPARSSSARSSRKLYISPLNVIEMGSSGSSIGMRPADDRSLMARRVEPRRAAAHPAWFAVILQAAIVRTAVPQRVQIQVRRLATAPAEPTHPKIRTIAEDLKKPVQNAEW